MPRSNPSLLVCYTACSSFGAGVEQSGLAVGLITPKVAGSNPAPTHRKAPVESGALLSGSKPPDPFSCSRLLPTVCPQELRKNHHKKVPRKTVEPMGHVPGKISTNVSLPRPRSDS